LEQSCDFGAIHAAAVHRGGNAPCVMLPGPSGIGKSTLTAALVADGFRTLGDDTIVLARDTLDVRAVPFGICLKNGAWQLLAARFPDLVEQPVHNRLDGKRVRYLNPGGQGVAQESCAPRPAAWIVFPQRVDYGDSDLIPISRPEALSRLAAQFCPLGAGLDLPKIDRLVRWIGGIACFELRYSTLDQGAERLKELIS
jgi:hypothetical protein